MRASRRHLQHVAAATMFFLFCLSVDAQAPSPSTPVAPSPPPRPAFTPTPEMLAIQAASEKDHQRVMDQLGIKQLRPGVDSDSQSPHAANYDESKANVYPNLPNPLLLNDGRRVTTADMWWNQRRPQIVEWFDREILGRTPAHLPKVTWELKSVIQESKGDIPVVTKTLIGHVDSAAAPSITVNIDLTLTTPAHASGPVPSSWSTASAKKSWPCSPSDFRNSRSKASSTPPGRSRY